MAEQKLGSSVKERPSKCTKLLVAAIDFGTVYSGYAYSFKSEWPNVMTNKWSGGDLLTYKTPSALLLNPDQSFNSFGFDAEKRYASLTDDGKDCKKYFFFRRFKMILKSSLEKRVHRKTQCIAENGLSVNAMKVFTHCINHMRKHLLKDIEEKLAGEITMDDIHFVLTVPAIWDDTAKMFMREAAVDAGIKSDQLLIALEPEAASIYCQLMHLESNENKRFFLAGKEIGAKYMVLDLGGGTADITIHQLKEDGSLAELVPASGGSWGGTCIDKALNDFLTKVFGETVMKIFKTDPEYLEDYFEFWHRFEVKKRNFETKSNKNDEQNEKDKSESRFAIQIPLALTEIVAKQNKQDMKKMKSDAIITNAIQKSQYRNDLTFEYGKLFMKSSFFMTMFNPTTELIINHLKKLYLDIGQDLKVILMVGGFSECSVIQEAVKKEFERKCRVVVPNQAGLAVVKGAVYFGHQPDLITERVSRYTYGIQTWPAFNETKHDKSKRVVMDDGPRCRDVFFKFVAKGDKIKPGDKKSYIFKSLRPNADTLDCGVFISNEKNPKYVDDEGCAKLGTLNIPLDGVDRNVDIEESLIFGDTELHVTACNCINKMEYKVTFDLLSENINFS
ncbi:heat shock 70 kDa protein 12A-like isoform X2 [Crassostrea angulata]|uniref:heat shock 70 kDa protein 12A-like isoform X2 n=1 Tax=Magallana angulata TaxID=2784310 RepID=UPI0022B1F6FD|nr:heat shock 70 kDa protein 12A-like isoform X2 [Crassostrea angulata]